jgi:hypothetical protein
VGAAFEFVCEKCAAASGSHPLQVCVIRLVMWNVLLVQLRSTTRSPYKAEMLMLALGLMSSTDCCRCFAQYLHAHDKQTEVHSLSS